MDEVIDLVGLHDVAHRRVGGSSLGMAQRLGSAALLGDPATLLLDEPANGLDPAGIRWMRDRLSGLTPQGRTVFVSDRPDRHRSRSHIASGAAPDDRGEPTTTYLHSIRRMRWLQQGVFLLLVVVAAACATGGPSSEPVIVSSVNPSNEAGAIIARIPDKPRYHSMEEIADKLGSAGLPCTDRRTMRPDQIDCSLARQSAIVVVFGSPAARDESVRRLTERPWLPAVFVVGANWLVNIDAYDQAQRVADVLGGIVVRHGPVD